MMENRPYSRPYSFWLRLFAGVIALAGVLGLSACGGGSGGAPNNALALSATLGSPDLFSLVGASLTVKGSTAPYTVTASNPNAVQISGGTALGTVSEGTVFTILPANVAADTPVVFTVRDSQGSTVTVSATIHARSVPLSVAPTTAVAYSGFPLTLLVTGGTTPYRAISSNPAVLQVASVAGNTIVLLASNVVADTPVVITILDAAGASVLSTVTVRAAPLLNTLTIVASNPTECGANAICSGQTGTATVTVQGPQGGAISGRAVRFDVIGSAYLITTSSPSQPLVTTLTVASDSSGVASVIIKANVNAPTQFVQLRVTDVASGQQLIGNFLIQQVTDGSKILTVIAGGTGGSSVKITSFFKGECSTGFPVDYFIYGGTPPYRISLTFPTGVTLVNNTVNASGGFFEVITNGTCVDPIVFSILDATGRQTTATLSNVEGTNVRPAPPPPPLSAILQNPGTGICAGRTFSVLVSGGTAPYNPTVSPSGPIFIPPAPAGPGFVAISGLTDLPPRTYNFAVGDSSTPKQLATFSITCPVP